MVRRAALAIKGAAVTPRQPSHPKKSLPTPVFEGRAARTLLAELLLLELVVVELLLLGLESSSPSALLELLVAELLLLELVVAGPPTAGENKIFAGALRQGEPKEPNEPHEPHEPHEPLEPHERESIRGRLRECAKDLSVRPR